MFFPFIIADDSQVLSKRLIVPGLVSNSNNNICYLFTSRANSFSIIFPSPFTPIGLEWVNVLKSVSD